jgi:hypothetical protein
MGVRTFGVSGVTHDSPLPRKVPCASRRSPNTKTIRPAGPVHQHRTSMTIKPLPISPSLHQLGNQELTT